MKPRPKVHEETAAAILANHFSSNVYFLETGSHGGPDVKIGSVEWEIKSPDGSSPRTIQNNMRKAGHQSGNVVIDLRRVKIHQRRAVGYVGQFMAGASSKFKRVIVITKLKKVLTIK